MTKILVVGGTGSLGGHAALHLQSLGHDVNIAGRDPAHPATGLAALPFLQGDYVAGDFTADRLRGFEWVVFAAGNDPRHVPPGSDFAGFLYQANHVAVPRFFAACREAGVARAVQLGSFYPQAAPQLADGNSYITSRRAACEGARAEASADFAVMSINAPFMVGTVAGLPSPMFEAYIGWARGDIPIPPIAPPGGTNFMSNRSLSEAIAGALERGEGGAAYLVGDETLSFAEYFQLFFDALGNPARIETVDAEHPLLPDVAIAQGRGNWIRFEPDPAEAALLGYRRGDVAAGVAEVAAAYGGQGVAE